MRKLSNYIKRFSAVIIAALVVIAAVSPVTDVKAFEDDWDFDVSDDYFYYGDYDDSDWDLYDPYGDAYDNSYGNSSGSKNDESVNTGSPVYGDVTTKKNSTTGYYAAIADDANLLSKSEKELLLEEMYPITEDGNAFLYTSNYAQYGDPMREAERVYYQYFSNGESGTMFMINMEIRELVVYSDGAIKKKVTEDFGYTITDNIYTYATDGDYYTCSSKAFGMIKDLLNDISIAQPMKNICNFFIAVNLGFFICYLIANAKSKASKASDSEMLKYAVINISNEHPTAILTNTTKRYVPRSSGGGHGHGGGGGHSGGGGHHGF